MVRWSPVRLGQLDLLELHQGVGRNVFCVSRDDLPRGPLMRSLVVVREDTLERTNGSRAIFFARKNL